MRGKKKKIVPVVRGVSRTEVQLEIDSHHEIIEGFMRGRNSYLNFMHKDYPELTHFIDESIMGNDGGNEKMINELGEILQIFYHFKRHRPNRFNEIIRNIKIIGLYEHLIYDKKLSQPKAFGEIANNYNLSENTIRNIIVREREGKLTTEIPQPTEEDILKSLNNTL